MITAIIFGIPCILLLRWIILETTRPFEQEWELDHICNTEHQDSQDEMMLLTCLTHNGLSE
jgi:hypothetical protein